MAKKHGRANGEGTYKRRKDGRWEAQYTVDTPSGVKRRSVYARTKAEVVAKLKKAIAGTRRTPQEAQQIEAQLSQKRSGEVKTIPG